MSVLKHALFALRLGEALSRAGDEYKRIFFCAKPNDTPMTTFDGDDDCEVEWGG